MGRENVIIERDSVQRTRNCIAPNLVEVGNKRPKEEGFKVTGRRRIRFAQTFNLVVSIFEAMFAPKPLDVEMVRVARPGGRIVMANWIPSVR